MALLQIEGLEVCYGKLRAVDGVSLSVNAGELVGYLGPNGAGKTTTLKCVAGMVRGFAGNVMIDGIHAAHDPVAVKQRIGFLHESGALYEMLTPREYFIFLADVRGLDRGRALEHAEHLLDVLDLQTEARGQRMQDFSKGMKQKVAIAATLMHKPRLLLLDEPLSGLDIHAASRFKQILSDYVEAGGAVLYSSHILDVVERLCSRAIIIDKGRVLAELDVAQFDKLHPGKTLEQVFQELTDYQAHEAGG